MSRTDLIHRIAHLVGHDILTVQEARDGWPGFATAATAKGALAIALYAAPVTLSHRARDAVERRVQNPGQGRPIVQHEGRMPLLLGIWEEEGVPVIAAYDPVRRTGHETRWSAFIGLDCLRRAARIGWAEEVNADGERLIAFTPPAFAAFAAVLVGDDNVSQKLRALASESQGLLPLNGMGEERERRTLSSIVRDARFRGLVHAAYNGRCAMCRIGLNLVEAAHLYPACADGSPDEVWNGVALCRNHHGAFDSHAVAIREADMAIVFHPSILDAAQTDPVAAAFVSSTLPFLAPPAPGHPGPAREMLRRRHLHFAPRYDWLR